MTHALFRNACATTAICAVLALGSTPAQAQEAAPPLDAPAATAPASPSAPQPTIVLPAETPAPQARAAASQPVIQAVAPAVPSIATPDDVARVASPAERRPAARAATAPATRSAPAPRPVAQTRPSSPEPLPPVASIPLTPPADAPSPALTAPQEGAQVASPQAISDNNNGRTAFGIAGLLAALGLGFGVYLASRRRRPEEADDVAPPVRANANGLSDSLEPELPLSGARAQAVEPTPHPTAAQRMGGEELAFAELPQAVAVSSAQAAPTNREERDALLEAMVSAAPDADNPFTSRKGRLRRARIMLQAREHQQKDPAKPFDWRTYKPSAGNPTPATPPRVTA